MKLATLIWIVFQLATHQARSFEELCNDHTGENKQFTLLTKFVQTLHAKITFSTNINLDLGTKIEEGKVLENKKVIGKGVSGEIVRNEILTQVSDKEVVIKQIRLKLEHSKGKFVEDLKKTALDLEVDLSMRMGRLMHSPFVFGCAYTQKVLFIVFERMDKNFAEPESNLFLRTIAPFDFLFYLNDIIAGLKDLWRLKDQPSSEKTIGQPGLNRVVSRKSLPSLQSIEEPGVGFVHSDIKPENLMLSLEGDKGTSRAFLIDFGLAQKLSDKESGFGTLLYLDMGKRQGAPPRKEGDLYALALSIAVALGNQEAVFLVNTNGKRANLRQLKECFCQVFYSENLIDKMTVCMQEVIRNVRSILERAGQGPYQNVKKLSPEDNLTSLLVDIIADWQNTVLNANYLVERFDSIFFTKKKQFVELLNSGNLPSDLILRHSRAQAFYNEQLDLLKKKPQVFMKEGGEIPVEISNYFTSFEKTTTDPIIFKLSEDQELEEEAQQQLLAQHKESNFFSKHEESLVLPINSISALNLSLDLDDLILGEREEMTSLSKLILDGTPILELGSQLELI